MIVVHLYGMYKKKFGSTFKLHVGSLKDAINLLEANFKGQFYSAMKNDEFHVCKGEVIGKHENVEVVERITLTHEGVEHYHLIPRVVGAASSLRKKGLGALLAGIVILGVSWFVPALAFAKPLGMSLMLSGAAAMLTPTTNVGSTDDEGTSYSFSGPSNASGQSAILPVAYGKKIRVGSVVTNASLISIATDG